MADLDEVLTAVHPVPMRYLPRRGRVERMGYARLETPVRLRRLPASEVGPVHRISPSFGSWVDVAAIEGTPFIRAGSMSVADLASYLMRADEPNRAGPIDCVFAGTPLSALVPSCDAGGRVSLDRQRDIRGDARLLDAAGTVTHDGGEAARYALQDFFDRKVRYVDGALFVDTGGPMARQVRAEKGPGLRLVATGTPALRAWDDEPLPRLRFDKAMRGLPSEGRQPGGRVRFPGCELPADCHGRGDPGHSYANAAPGLVVGPLATVLRGSPREALADPDRRKAVADLCWLALRGGVGAIAPEEVEAVLGHVEETAGLMRRWVKEEDQSVLVRVWTQCAALRRAEERRTALEVPDEDIRAVAGLRA